jgi:hypothetical protein
MEFAQSAPAALQCITDAAGVSLILILSDTLGAQAQTDRRRWSRNGSLRDCCRSNLTSVRL